MAKATKPTVKQKLAFEELMKAVAAGKQFDMKSIMLKAGYSLATAQHPDLNLTSKENWQDMLNKVRTQPLMDTLNSIANDRDKDGSVKDKDAAIKAIKEIFTLKDLYPATKSKIIGLFDKITSLEE